MLILHAQSKCKHIRMAHSQGIVNLLSYWPSAAWCAYHAASSTIALTQLEYRKAYHLNQCAILTANGLQVLSVPLQGGRSQKNLITNIAISYAEPWQRLHLNSIKAAYGKAAFFDELWPLLQDLYTLQYSTLYELNVATLLLVKHLLRWQVELHTDMSGPIAREEVLPILPPYPHVFQNVNVGSNVTILDLLMCEGGQAAQYLMNAC
jgi:hypothetical protein